MPWIGGPKRMRGYIEGRFRDNQAAVVQLELRKMFFKRWGATGFISMGSVSENLQNLWNKPFKYSGGAGIRYQLDPSKKLNIRLDYGITPEGGNFYFTFGEAF